MSKSILKASLVAAGILLMGAGCFNRGTQAPAAPSGGQPTTIEQPSTPTTPTAQAEIKLAKSDTLGEYFTDGKGMTLYLYTKDTADKSVCEGQCLVNWPIFYGQDLKIPEGLNKADFGETVTPDGQKISTYKGWPLYYFIKDKKPGDTLGEDVGKVWYVMKANYSVLFVTDASGNHLVDGRGNTLYLYTKDTANKSVCEGQCLVNWPAFYAEDLVLPSTWNKADFAEIERADKVEQNSFKGWPLYYYVNDKARGDKTGQGVGGVWYVIDPDKQAAAK
jgi:predicted lipoprotein with Yx(FWY)xxD motif